MHPRSQVNPFDPNSPIKQSAITTFPQDLFFVLRVVQLLRGMASGGSGPRTVYVYIYGSILVRYIHIYIYR